MIRIMKEYDLGQPFMQVRSVPVSLGKGKEEARLFVHANTPNLDPWEEAMTFPVDTLKMTLIAADGTHLWQRDLGINVIPGIWFSPFISFDLDGDGVDEIWYVNETHPKRPFSFEHRVLERIDPLTGETTGQWPWPRDLVHETMSHAYRFNLAAGYAHGAPVLICGQGTYGDMYLQGYSAGMELRWKLKIAASEPGARAAHHTIVFDINKDGVDEIFWGERVLSVDDGHELFCGDRDSFKAHSDILIPFEDPESGKIYVYTCREGQNSAPRVVLYDDRMNAVWRSPDGGHMHGGWVAAIGENRRYVAMALSLALDAKGGDIHSSTPILYYFDAVTGRRIDNPLTLSGEMVMPVDINGDGYSEFFVTKGDRRGDVMDRFGETLAHFDGNLITIGKILDLPGQQAMLGIRDQGKVIVVGDDEAVDGPGAKYRDYNRFMQHMMGSGYNSFNAHPDSLLGK